ncbi:MAG: hypothetical protein IJ053_03625 [Lachnospiraceae bacterium]|nr:hypothetical protein [Lachnospiraceae bacterium]
MAFMDMFSNIANWNPQDLANGGIIGASMGAKLRAEEAEKAARPKPGKYCAKICTVNDERCAPCLELQRRFEHALGQLEKLEETAEMSSEEVQQLLSQKKIVKCSLCGAPYEKGRSDCAYCGTAYPADALDIDIAVSKTDRNIQIMQKVDEVWALFAQKGELVGGYLKSNNKWADKILKLGAKFGYTSQSLNAATSNEIKQSADQYGIPLSQYLHGVAMGDLKTPKMFQLEELNKALEQQHKEFQKQQALNEQRAAEERQARQAVAEQKRQSQREYWERYQQARSAPKYASGGGGGSFCCGTCAYYYDGNKCARYDRKLVKASDYCRDYKS